MKNLVSYLIFLSIALFCMTIQIFAMGSKMFGPYRVVTRSIDKCQLPIPVDKDRECINNLMVQKISRTKELIGGLVTVPQDIPNLRGMVYVDLWRDGGYKPFVNKKFNNACDEQLVGSIIKTYLTTKKNCLVVQGENPIYKQATSTFKNPTYAGK